MTSAEPATNSISERLKKGDMGIVEFAAIIEKCKAAHPTAKVHIGRNIFLVQTKEGLKSLSELLHTQR